jgi:hypothetical protein
MNNIIKRRKTANYTQINNLPIQQDLKDLSAIGLLTYIMSLPEDWVLYKTQLYNTFTRRTVEGAWKILVQKNYAIGFTCYISGKKGKLYFYNVSDIPFTQNDFDTFVKEVIEELTGEGKTVTNPEPIKDSPFTIPEKIFTVQNVQYKLYSTNCTSTKEIETKETKTNKQDILLSIDNYQENEETKTLSDDKEEFRKKFTEICNDFYAVFSAGRWTKKQWNTLIKKFVSETIDSGRYKKIPVHKMKGYAFKALERIADHSDYKNSEEFAEYQEVMRELHSLGGSISSSNLYNWLED